MRDGINMARYAMKLYKVNIVLRGRVQGVGFRYYAKKCADEMKIAGKIWNNYDGSVEIIVSNSSYFLVK